MQENINNDKYIDIDSIGQIISDVEYAEIIDRLCEPDTTYKNNKEE